MRKEIEAKIDATDFKLGFEIGPMEEAQGKIKLTLKELEGKQSILDSLERVLNSLKPELEPVEIIEVEQSLEETLKLYSTSCEMLRKKLRELSEELGSKRKFLDKLQRARSWVAKMECELDENQQTTPISSSEVHKRIELLKKRLGAVKDFGDGPLAEIKREAGARDHVELQQIISGLDTSKGKLNSNMGELIKRLQEETKKREAFEKHLACCSAWVQQVETALVSDLKGSSNLNVLEEQQAKYSKLKAQLPQLEELERLGKELIPSLNEPDRHILGDTLQNTISKVTSLAGTLGDKLTQLQAAINEFKELSGIIEQAIAFTNGIKERLNMLNKPVGSAIEDSQGFLISYEVEFKHQILIKTIIINV